MVWPHAPAWLVSICARGLTRWGIIETAGLAQIGTRELVQLARDDSLRALLNRMTSLSEALQLVSRHPELATAAVRQLAEKGDQQLSEDVLRKITEEPISSIGEQAFVFNQIASNADRLAPQAARGIFQWCLARVTTPPDPYDPDTTTAVSGAGQAASAILALDSSLDDLMVDALEDDTTRATAKSIAASALKERPEQAAARFARYVAAVTPSSEELLRFADDCDAGRGTLRVPRGPLPTLGTLSRLVSGSWHILLLAGTLVVPIAAAAIAALVVQHLTGGLTSVGVGPGVVVGALAVLAAVHILTVQLAAQRLPGPIAAAVILPRYAPTAYATGIVMLVISIIGEEAPAPHWYPALVASLLLVLFSLLVFAMAFSSLRTTSASDASVSVAIKRRGQARRTGRRMQSLHARALAAIHLVETTDYVRQYPSPEEAVERYAVRARTSGFADVDVRALKEGTATEEWQRGSVWLDVIVMPGVPVTRGRELASIVTAAGVNVPKSTVVHVDGAFKVREERSLERFAELCVALAAQLPKLVNAGDPGGARRVLAAMAQLLADHIAVVRAGAAASTSTSAPLPMSPVIRLTIEQTVIDLLTAPEEAERSVLVEALETCLELASPHDGMIVLIAQRLSGRTLALPELGVLYRAGCRACQVDSDMDLQFVQNALHALAKGDDSNARYANEIAGRLVLYCAEVAPSLSRRAWSRWWTSSGSTVVADKISIACRIGAGALPVGNLFLCAEVALALHGIDFAVLQQAMRAADRAAFEDLLSQLYGRLLGSDAEQRIVEFLDFAEALNSATRGI